MGLPYRARVSERWFLNLPGFHGGAYVVAYVEDTRARGLEECDCDRDECEQTPGSAKAGGSARRPSRFRRQCERSDVTQIKTFGDVDSRSLEQLERCMAAGDAELGVLCADHHPGYSQPIGGGIAYEGYVSPSGVGYDIGCGN